MKSHLARQILKSIPKKTFLRYFIGVHQNDNVIAYIDGYRAMMYYLTSGQVRYRDGKFHVTEKYRPAPHVTHKNFFDMIERGEVSVDMNGYWDDQQSILNNISKRLLRHIKDGEEELEKIKIPIDTPLNKPYSEMSAEEKDLYRYLRNFEKNLFESEFGSFSKSAEINLYLPTGEDDRLEIFFGRTPSELILGRRRTKNHELYRNPPAYPITINKSITFANFFISEKFEEKKYPELKLGSLQTFIGQLKIQQVLAKENVAFGQTGNSSFDIYEDDECFILTTSFLEDDYEYFLHSEEHGAGHEYTIDEKKRYDLNQRLERMTKVNEDRIDMSVWRWMAAETDDIQPEDWERIGDNFCTIPYSGELSITNYYCAGADVSGELIAILKKTPC